MTGRLRAALPPLAMAVAIAVVALAPMRPAPTPPASTPSIPAPLPQAPPTVAAKPGPPPSTALRTVALPPPPAAQTAAAPPDSPPPDGPPPDSSPPRRPSPAGPVVRPSDADAGRGRLLLDRVERGAGPTVEIGWPDDPAARQRLRTHLARCAGWQVLLLADGRLWRAADPPGRPWAPDPTGAHSGLLRDLEGSATDPGAVEAVRRRHGLAGGQPAATVARHWDARLLGGLDRLIGAGMAAARIRARYAIDAGRLLVVDVSVVDVRGDGRPVPGRVDLGPVSGCAR